MSFAHAGQWAGYLPPGTYEVLDANDELVTLYSDASMGTPVGSTFSTDEFGIGSFFTVPGAYQVRSTAIGTTWARTAFAPLIPVVVGVNPLDAGGGAPSTGHLVLAFNIDGLNWPPSGELPSVWLGPPDLSQITTPDTVVAAPAKVAMHAILDLPADASIGLQVIANNLNADLTWTDDFGVLPTLTLASLDGSNWRSVENNAWYGWLPGTNPDFNGWNDQGHAGSDLTLAGNGILTTAGGVFHASLSVGTDWD